MHAKQYANETNEGAYKQVNPTINMQIGSMQP